MSDSKSTPVDAITHPDKRANIPPAELESVLEPEDKRPIKAAYARRNKDLDPQLVWRGKADWSDLVVDAPPIYLQEQVQPKALIEDLRAHVANGRPRSGSNDAGPSLFDHFGLTEEDREAEIEFYRQTRKWSNRMILGDSMQVMASLAEPHRLSRRPHFLREWGHHDEANIEEIFAGDPGAGCPNGSRTSSRSRVAVGGDFLHSGKDRVLSEVEGSGETLRKWVQQAERDQGVRAGQTSEERERIKALEREVRELRQANEILRKASAYFAQAELDRRFKP